MAYYGGVSQESDECSTLAYCINCKKEHPFYSKYCEQWKTEKKIRTICTKENISDPAAKKIVEFKTPKVDVSYADAISK